MRRYFLVLHTIDGAAEKFEWLNFDTIWKGVQALALSRLNFKNTNLPIGGAALDRGFTVSVLENK